MKIEMVADFTREQIWDLIADSQRKCPSDPLTREQLQESNIRSMITAKKFEGEHRKIN